MLQYVFNDFDEQDIENLAARLSAEDVQLFYQIAITGRRDLYLSRIPTASLGEVEAVADAALFLASDDCKWITGHCLNVDGGYGAAGLSYDLSAK